MTKQIVPTPGYTRPECKIVEVRSGKMVCASALEDLAIFSTDSQIEDAVEIDLGIIL